MKEKTIVLLAIVLAIITMLLFACTGVAAVKAQTPVDESVCAVSSVTHNGETVADALLTSGGL